MKISYSKPALSFREQISLLKSRGLIIENEKEALDILTHINYYRFSAYMYPFLENKDNHLFKIGTHFHNILAISNFDRELRLILLDAIERIEVSLRTTIIYVLSQKYNPFWLSNKELFYNQERYTKDIERIKDDLKRSDEKFIAHYFSKYSEEIPPAWITLEIVSFGSLSLLYSNLKSNKDRKEIASRYGLNHIVFTSWFHSLAYVRNVCAHHSRLWNRELGIQPAVPHSIGGLWLKPTEYLQNDRTYIIFAIILYFLEIINNRTDFINKLFGLFKEYPMIDLAPMGFPKNWQDEELFNLH